MLVVVCRVFVIGIIVNFCFNFIKFGKMVEFLFFKEDCGKMNV